MADTLITAARDALAAAVALAEACHEQSQLAKPDDWDDFRDTMRAAVRKIDAGAAVLAVLVACAAPDPA